MSYREIMERIREGYDPEKMEGVNALYQFEVQGEDQGFFYLQVEDGEAEMEEGQAESHDVKIAIDEDDFFRILGGEIKVPTAFLTGKIKVKGNMSLAMKLQSLLA